MEESPRVLQHVEQHGYQSITEMVAALGGNAEHARLVCFDLFEQGQLQRHQRRTGKRGRPEYLYGVGDFSHVTHTTPPALKMNHELSPQNRQLRKSQPTRQTFQNAKQAT